MKTLFAAAEIFPFSKTGGLADMAHALPKALAEEGAEVAAVTPLYRFVDKERYGIVPTGRGFDIELDGQSHRVEIFGCIHDGVEHLFLYNELLCDREHPYGPPGGEYHDNDLRFAIFCHALVGLAREAKVRVLHLNDWHTALAAPLARDAGLSCKIVYTIHNLAYQGIFPYESLRRIGVSDRHFTMEAMEFWGQVNWMKGGIAYADAVTTVSPSYAVEIQTTPYGCGLEGFLRNHAKKLTGILNGIDTNLYDPAADPSIPCRFDAENPDGKNLCKKGYLDEIDIHEYEKPLFIFIGRFVTQKGIDLIAETADRLCNLPLTLSILGEGEQRWHEMLEVAAKRNDNLHLRFGYDEALSHRMYAAADFLLMPSRFEPCGLNQMIAMRYGTLPVVRRIGGLRDTVHETGSGICGEGIGFDDSASESLVEAVERAMVLYDRKSAMKRARRFDMKCDFSIRRCARKYLELYRSLD